MMAAPIQQRMAVACVMPAYRLLYLLFLCVWLILAATPLAAQEFEVEGVQTRIIDGVYHLDTRVDYPLNDKVLETLDSGVPLTFELEIEVLRPRAWLWNETVYTLHQFYRLEYHALTRQYLVTNLNSNVQYSYPTQQTAVYAMGVINNLPMIDARLLKHGVSYSARIRARLSLDELPSPLRFWAYLSDQWRLTSEWYEWLLQ